MRIYGAVVAILTACNMIFPQYALSAEIKGNNETKLIFKTKENIQFIGGMAIESYEPDRPIIYNFDGYVPVKSPDEIKRSAVLEKWMKKQGYLWKNLPEGKFAINASAYTAAADECGKSDGITASGLKVKERHTIACPPQFPFGTKIKIEKYGTYICEDRGGAIKGNKFDIYMETKKEAFAFGRRNLMAEVIN